MHVHSLFQISMPIFVVVGASQSHASSLSQVHTPVHSLLSPLCLVPLSYLFQFSKCVTLLLQTTSFHLPGCFSFYLGIRVISSQYLSQFPGPCGSILPVLPDPFPIHSMTASMTFYNYSTRDMFPAVSPKPKKHLVCSRCTSIFIQGINQLKFWVTTSMANEPQQQGLNPLPWLNVHILYILPHWTLPFLLFLCLTINTRVYTHIHQSWERYYVTFQLGIPSFNKSVSPNPPWTKGTFYPTLCQAHSIWSVRQSKAFMNGQRKLFSEHLPNIYITLGAWKKC